jgi:hypothetical protein
LVSLVQVKVCDVAAVAVLAVMVAAVTGVVVEGADCSGLGCSSPDFWYFSMFEAVNVAAVGQRFSGRSRL